MEQQRKDLLAGLELKVQEKTDELKQTYLSVLVTLSRTVEKKDLGTYGHSMRVCDLSSQDRGEARPVRQRRSKWCVRPHHAA